MPEVLISAWLILIAVTVWWWLGSRVTAAPAPQHDLYGDQVATFRAQIHDWDRGGA